MLFFAWGCTVRNVTAHPAAMAALTEQAPDVLFVDIGKPSLRGLDLVRHVCNGTATRPGRIIGVTTYLSSELSERATEAGCDHLFTKPTDPVVLHRLLKSF